MIRKGDVLRHKNGIGDVMVLSVIDDLCAISIPNDFGVFLEWKTIGEIRALFDLPKEKWRPEDGEKYWCLTMENFGMYKECVWGKKRVFDEWNMSFGNCFRTREEAEAKAEEIRRVLQGN